MVASNSPGETPSPPVISESDAADDAFTEAPAKEIYVYGSAQMPGEFFGGMFNLMVHPILNMTLGVMMILFATAQTVYSVPYWALGIELSPTYHGRTRVAVVRTFFARVAAFSHPGFFPSAPLPCSPIQPRERVGSSF